MEKESLFHYLLPGICSLIIAIIIASAWMQLWPTTKFMKYLENKKGISYYKILNVSFIIAIIIIIAIAAAIFIPKINY